MRLSNLWKPWIVLLSLVCAAALGQEAPGPEASALLKEVQGLDQQGRLDDALKMLDEGLQRFVNPDYDRFFTLNYKFRLLTRLGRHEAAIAAAVEKANIIRSPKQALQVAGTCLATGNSECALDWIEKSVDRGLQSYDVFEGEIYDPLRGGARFSQVIERAKRNAGIGVDARPFARKSLSGRDVSLNDYRGKVLLIDFWATWCAPCRKEMPRLVELYAKYHDKGFEIVGFSEDLDRDQLSGYLKRERVPWENVFCPEGEADETVKLYEVVNVPASFLVDRDGVVRHVNLTEVGLEKAVEDLVTNRGVQ